jgi:tetratricopeptide (TPR) repeat protein
VAEAIETLFVERLEEFYSLLAYHYSKAEDWENAQVYLFRAGDQAGSIAADAEAFAHYEEAVEAYTRVFGEKWDPVERAILERKMGEALFRTGEPERALEYLYRALDMLGSPFPTSSGALGRAIVAQLFIQFGHRLLWWLPRRTASPETVRFVGERGLLYGDVGLWELDQSRNLFAALVSLNEAESFGAEWRATCEAYILMTCDFLSLRRTSRHYYERCVRWIERGGHGESREELQALAGVQMCLGMHEYVATGEWTKALDRLHAARHAFLAIGNTRYLGVTLDLLSHLLTDQGELDEALNLCEEEITFVQERGDRGTEAWAHMEVGEVLFAQGAFEEAEAHLRPAAQQLLASFDPGNGAKANARIAHCYLKLGRLEEARAILAEEAARLRESGHTRGYFARNVHTGKAAACLLALEQATDAATKQALKQAKSACRDLLKYCRADVPSLVPAYRMQGAYEYLRGRPSKAEQWWGKSLEHAEKLGARYEGALTQLEIGRRTGDRTALETAEAAFAEMGAQFDLARVRELLDGAS